MNTIGNASTVIIFIILTALPFITVTLYGITREGSRYLAFVISTCIVGVLSIFLMQHKQYQKKWTLFSPLGRAIFASLLVSFLANLQGLDFATSIVGSSWRHQGYILLLSGTIFWAVAYFLNTYDKDFILKTLLTMGFTHLLILAWAAVDSVKLLLGLPVTGLYNGRIADPIGNPNSLAGLLVMTLPFFVLNNKAHMFIRVGVYLLNIVVLIATGSRSGLLAFLIISTLIISIELKKWGKKVLMVGVLASLLVIFLFSTYVSSFNRYSIWDNQLIIWKAGVEAVVKRPILGYGQENFELIFPEERMVKVDNAHNIFLETAVSSGLVGLSLFIAILVLGYRKSPLTVKIALIAFLIRAQFNPLSLTEIVYFWFLLGLVEEKNT